MKIDLLGEAPPPARAYKLSPNERRELQEMLQKELKNGTISKSKSPTGAPLFFVNKKNGTLRPVVDYRKLNKITKRGSYPLPDAQRIIEQLAKAKYFTSLDLKSGYNQIQIKKEDHWKTAFRTEEGLFEYNVMPFGLTNAPSVFQRMMNDILREWINKETVLVYLDDVLIFAETLEELEKTTHEVLKAMEAYDLKLNAEKCEWEKEEISFLGHRFKEGKKFMNKDKIEAIKNWKTLTNVKEVQRFLGFANFYWRFIENYSKIARPLTRLTQKDYRWRWGPDEEGAFNELKK